MKKPFDSEVKVGELRIFADLDRPVVALIAEDRGAFGFRIIPVSDYTSISCEGEQLVGNRVYQHWNACSVPRSFALRSWLVATLPPEELSNIRNSSLFTLHSSLSSLSPYRRAHLFSIGIPRRAFSPFTLAFSLRKAGGFLMAAGLVFALVFAIHLDLDRASHKDEWARASRIVARPAESEGLVACEEIGDRDEIAAVAAEAPKFDLPEPKCVAMSREPEIAERAKAPRMVKASKAAVKECAMDPVDAARLRALPLETVDDRAIAVMMYSACGVKTADREFGDRFVSSTEKLVECVRGDRTANEYTRRLVAIALCHAYVATSNPDLKTSAEAALNAVGDRRPVTIVARGYDLIEDWFVSRPKKYYSTTEGKVALPVEYPDWFRFLRSRAPGDSRGRK